MDSEKDFFNSLPDEIIERFIFTYLKSVKKTNENDFALSSELKIASMVCKRWNGIISNSIFLLSGFTFKITKDSIDNFIDSFAIRRYSSCEVYSLQSIEHDKYLEILKIYDDISSITFVEDTPSRYNYSLASSKLETLKMYDNHNHNIPLDATAFTKLKTLSIVNRPQRILNEFQKLASIKELSVYGNEMFHFPSNNNWMITKLSVGKISDVISFIGFLESQKAHLQELSFNFRSDILEYVMLNMDELMKLKIYFEYYPDFLITENFVNQEPKLKELVITYKQVAIRNTDIFESIIRHYSSSIETLKLNFYFTWKQLSRDRINMPNLKNLSMIFSDNFILQSGIFDNLQTIYIENYNSRYDIHNLRRLEQLKELAIDGGNLKMSFLAEYYPNLIRLRLGNFQISKHELKGIVTKLPYLEVLFVKSNSLKFNDDDLVNILQKINRTTLKIIIDDQFWNKSKFS